MFDFPQQFSDRHRSVILKYLISGRTVLTSREWKENIEGFNILHSATASFGNEQLSFKSIYELYVDRVYAEQFINSLLNLSDHTQYPPIRAYYSRQIVNNLQTAGLRPLDQPSSNLLLAYCLYFWESFAAGYAFEVEIFRDPHRSGIRFRAHDIRIRSSRLSAYDLEILGLRGDIKTSFYFLYVGRGTSLPHDFYISRIYEGRSQRTFVVMLQLDAWEAIDGDTIAGLLNEVTHYFPNPVKVTLPGGSVVIAEYGIWKNKVLKRQEDMEGENGTSRIDEMSTEDFDKVIDEYIERESQDTGELSAPIFYETLENIFAKPEVPTVVELEAEVIGSNIQFTFPQSEVAGVEIHGNEIIINNLRFVVHLAPAKLPDVISASPLSLDFLKVVPT